MVDVKLGKKAARHDPRTLVYAKYRTATEDWIAASGQSPSRMAWGQLLADLQNL